MAARIIRLALLVLAAVGLVLVACADDQQEVGVDQGEVAVDPAPPSAPEAEPQSSPEAVAAASAPSLSPTPTSQPPLGVIPPCTPAPGSDVDPCAPRRPIQRGMEGGSGEPPYSEPQTLREQLQDSPPIWVAHLVLRGTYLPNTARCNYGDPFLLPEYSLKGDVVGLIGSNLFKCYVDVRANEWLVGTGPSQVTVLVWSFTYGPGEYTPPPDDPHGRVTEEDALEFTRKLIEPAARQYENREQILFLGPPSTLGSQVWALHHWWDIERQDDDTVLAFQRWARIWERFDPDTFATFRSRLVLTLPEFKTGIQQAHQLRLTQNGGRIGADTNLPELVTDARNLVDFYEETGFTDATMPPPPCGLAVSDPTIDQDLMRDCWTLLSAKDTLRGTGKLNWSVDLPMADWDGVTVEGTPQRVTRLELADKGLTGSIPAELERLGLTTLKLSGNSLTGCIPPALRNVDANDLDTLGLPDCG